MPELDLLLLDHDLPAELRDAPSWARLLYAQGLALSVRLGEEPDVDGRGGGVNEICASNLGRQARVKVNCATPDRRV